MIRKLLATTAIATLVAAGAHAQSTTQPVQTAPSTTQSPATTQPETPMVIKAEGNLASNIIGKDVYNGTGDDAQKIGSVNDLVVTPDGQVQALVIGVGGFLGIGQKDVAIEYNLAKWEEKDNDRWLVVDTTADALKAQKEFDRQAYEPMPADADVAETKPATKEDLAKAPANADNEDKSAASTQQSGGQMAATPVNPGTDQTAANQNAPASDTTQNNGQQNMAAQTDNNADEKQTAQAPASDQNATDETKTGAIDRSSLKEMPTDQIKAEDFVGTTVYGANDENVGEVGDIVLSKDGKVDAVLIDVGGFLGIGEKEVALGMDNLQFMTDEDGDLYLYTSLSKEQLEAQQAYDEGSYAENRDKMRMNVPAAN